MGPERFVVLKIYHHLLIISGQVDSVETVETVETVERVPPIPPFPPFPHTLYQ